MERDTARYGHLLRAIYDRPWAIAEEALHDLVASLTLAASGRIGREEFEALLAMRAPGRVNAPRSTSVAVIPIHGVVSQGQGLLGLLLGGTSVDQIATEFTSAMNDRQVDAVALDINSPGGTIDGVEELASMIRSSRGRKPILAVANGRAESAAYWIGSAADEFAVTPSGSVGSIGVFTVHQDVSAMADKEGIRTTLVSYGKFKTEGNPWEPLTDEARTAIQARVDHYGKMFERAVAKGRNVPIEQVRTDFGQGRSITAGEAVRLGMVDREQTLDEAITGVARGLQAPAPVAALSMTDTGRSEPPVEVGAAPDALEPEPRTEPPAATATVPWMRTKAQRAIAQAVLAK